MGIYGIWGELGQSNVGELGHYVGESGYATIICFIHEYSDQDAHN